MKRGPGEDGPLILAVTLTTVAGFVDASAFVRFNGLFVSFMSGNTTQLAALPSQGRVAEAAAALGVVVLFVMGAFAGRFIALSPARGRRATLLGLVAVLLTLGAWAGHLGGQPATALGVAAMALAMGMQNSVLQRVGDARASLTYVTGTLVNFAHSLADAVEGRPSDWPVYLLLWLGLAMGAGLGALATNRFGPLALLGPAAVAALIAVWVGGFVRRPPAAGSSS